MCELIRNYMKDEISLEPAKNFKQFLTEKKNAKNYRKVIKPYMALTNLVSSNNSSSF